MPKKFPTIIIISTAVLLSLTYAVISFQHETRRKTLPAYGQVKDFQLTDEQGDSFSLARLKGNVWVANFFFTTCSDICPMMSKNMATLQNSFLLADGIQLVSITVNPENDSPPILKKYADKFNAQQRKWHFLTGPRAMIKDLAVNSFKLGSIEEPVFHSSKFALVDQDGIIRGYYDGVESGEVSQLYKDAALLFKKK